MADEANPEPEIEALIHPGDDGKFWAEVVGLSGCYTQGDNYSKILARLRDAHELCSQTPSSSPPPGSSVSLGDGATVADLKATLATKGWAQLDGASEIHSLFGHTASGSRLCLLRDDSEALNSGFRLAIAKFLGGTA